MGGGPVTTFRLRAQAALSIEEPWLGFVQGRTGEVYHAKLDPKQYFAETGSMTCVRGGAFDWPTLEECSAHIHWYYRALARLPSSTNRALRPMFTRELCA